MLNLVPAPLHMAFVLFWVSEFLMCISCIKNIFINDIKHEPIIKQPMFVWVSKLDFSTAKPIKNYIAWSIWVLSIDHVISHPWTLCKLRRKTRTGNGDCECQHEGAIHGTYMFEH